MNRRKGVTLLELLLSVLLMTGVLLAVANLFATSRIFYFASEDDVVISYELQYAISHIYKYVMQAMGDGASPAIDPDPAGGDILSININTSDPLTSSNYSSGMTTYTYRKDGNELKFNDGVTEVSLVPKITVTDVSFTLDNNLLSVSLEGYYKDINNRLRFNSSCYPRLASF